MTVMCNPGAAAAGAVLRKPSPAEPLLAPPAPARIQARDAPMIPGDLHRELPAHTSRWPSPSPAPWCLPGSAGRGTMPAETDPAAKPCALASPVPLFLTRRHRTLLSPFLFKNQLRWLLQTSSAAILLPFILSTPISAVTESQNHRITESQNSRGWKGPLWVI